MENNIRTDTSLAGVTFKQTFKGLLSLKVGDPIILRHTPLKVGGRNYPNCVTVYTTNGDEIGKMPEKETEQKKLQKEVVKRMTDGEEVKGIVTFIKWRHIAPAMVSLVEKLKTDDSDLILTRIQEELKLQKGALYDKKPDDRPTFPCGVFIHIDGDADVYQKDGKRYERLTHFLKSKDYLIHSDKMLAISKMFADGFKSTDQAKVNAKWAKYAKRYMNLQEDISNTYNALISIPQDFNFGLSEEEEDSINEMKKRLDAFENKPDKSLGFDGFMDYAAKYGTEFHTHVHFIFQLWDNLPQEITDSIKDARPDKITNLLKLLIHIDPYEVRTEDMSNHTRYDEELGIAGTYDLQFKTHLTKGELITADVKSGDIISYRDNVPYPRQENCIQVGTYAKWNGHKKGLIMYLGNKDTPVIVEVDSELEYKKLLTIKNLEHINTLPNDIRYNFKIFKSNKFNSNWVQVL